MQRKILCLQGVQEGMVLEHILQGSQCSAITMCILFNYYK